jgi:hypothetical protein
MPGGSSSLFHIQNHSAALERPVNINDGSDPIEMGNDCGIREMCERTDLTVRCWGSHGMHQNPAERF